MFPERAACAFVLLLAIVTGSAAQDSLPTDPETGLVLEGDWQLVLANCSGCHSIRLVTQNGMSAEGWLETIRWMQEKHNLWDLGKNEEKIVAYLETHYGVPELPARRSPLNQPPIDDKEPTL